MAVDLNSDSLLGHSFYMCSRSDKEPLGSLREQTKQESDRDQNAEDGKTKEDAQPELFEHASCTSLSSVRYASQASDPGPCVTIW